MDPPKVNPLQDVHCEGLRCLCDHCGDTADIIARAQAAGYDMTQAAQINAMQLQKAQETRKQFFPNA